MAGNQLQWLNCDRLYTNFYTLDLLKLFKYSHFIRSNHEKKNEMNWTLNFSILSLDQERKNKKKNGNEWLHILFGGICQWTLNEFQSVWKRFYDNWFNRKHFFFIFTNSRLPNPLVKSDYEAAIHWLLAIFYRNLFSRNFLNKKI